MNGIDGCPLCREKLPTTFLALDLKAHTLPEDAAPEELQSQLIPLLRTGDVKLLKEMLKRDVDLNKFNKNGVTPLSVAIKTERLYLVKLMVSAGADVNKANRDG
jgi:ankyrin repeat protein